MTDLLAIAVRAHGGLERWSSIKSIQANASIGGAIWYLKSKGDCLRNVTVDLETQFERVTMDFPEEQRRTIFQRGRIVSQNLKGQVSEVRFNPEKSFEGHKLDTPWDNIHVAYFSGEALWTYLTSPFLYTYPGFETEEIAPIQVGEEIWRRLRITFPDYVKSHTQVQYSCFGPDGLLRRHDYTVDILGGATGLNYATEYRDIAGIKLATKRRIIAWEGNFKPIPEPMLVTIDLSDVALVEAKIPAENYHVGVMD